MAETAKDLIKSSLRILNVVATGETPSADEIQDGLSALNSMLESWSNESLLIDERVEEKFTLVSGQSSYTMGPGANFNTIRPIRIDEAFLEIQAPQPYQIPVDILNVQEWSSITDKDVSTAIPTKLFVAGTYPNETLKLWPKPSVANNLVLWSMKPFSRLANESAEINLPPGYSRALKYNLAVEIAAEYGKEASMSVQSIAIESKAALKRINTKVEYLTTDEATGSARMSFDWRTGE